jgi:ABC-type transport system substrate-binding protein
MKKPAAYFLYSMVGPLTVIFSRMAWEKQGGLKTANPTGTGPFIMTQHEYRNILTARKNPDYFVKGRPYLDGIESRWIPDRSAAIAAYRTGQIDTFVGRSGWDEVDQVLSTEKGKTDLNAFQHNAGGQPYFGVFHDKAPFSDIRLRQAVSMALDRTAMVKARYKEGRWSIGFPTDWSGKDYPPIPEEFGPNYAYDPASAKKMLAAAGAEGMSFPLFVSSTTGQPDDQVPLALEYWKAIGLKPDLKVMDNVAFNQQYFGHQLSGMTYGAGLTGGTDLDDFMYRNLRTGEVANIFMVSDGPLDSLLDASQLEFDRAKREVLGAQIQAREFANVNRVWAASYFLADFKRPYVQGGYISHDVYFWANGWGLYQLADTWLDK